MTQPRCRAVLRQQANKGSYCSIHYARIQRPYTFGKGFPRSHTSAQLRAAPRPPPRQQSFTHPRPCAQPKPSPAHLLSRPGRLSTACCHRQDGPIRWQVTPGPFRAQSPTNPSHNRTVVQCVRHVYTGTAPGLISNFGAMGSVDILPTLGHWE